ncbi:MAG: helix-turn-helix domain-containing protein [Sphingobacteriales bacterium]|nr:helix-turn-helix domain-containing protein [Sphingobacteriales bacterium]
METIDVSHQLATEFVLKTSENVFVTGKAGTGKTTFLRAVQKNSIKNTVVAAPTGVAAINAGGMTLHSLFQLPFNAFIPTKQRVPANFSNIHSLFENFKFSKAKIELLKELELLIIDEVSMLRADTLDCIDTILRTVRKNQEDPFGGVQVLFIGDLFQLPPVVKDEEWAVLKDYYDTPFFFSAQVMKESHFLNIEFTKIYRQNEEKFIRLLNKVRNNEMTEDDFYLLNDRLQPEMLSELEDYITLSTHNVKVDKINQAQLQKLEGDVFEFTAQIDGDFNENALPTEMKLQLKTGAQVMFIKNDSKPEKKYYNGKLATVKKITKDEITVQFFDDGSEFKVEQEKWENIRYNYNTATDKIEEDVIGSFTQYPLRLAWAITIHKSQGLTFDKAVIDAGYAFAAGQVYVALSRCTNINGLFLMTQISANAIMSDARIVDFTENYLSSEQDLQQQLPFHKMEYAKKQLIKAFDWNKMVDLMVDFAAFTEEKKLAEKEEVLSLILSLEKKIRELKQTAASFSVQLQEILKHLDKEENQTLLQQRVLKSIHYFGDKLANDIIKPLHNYIASLHNKKGVRGFLKKADEVEQALISKLKQIEKLQFGDTTFYEGSSFYNADTSLSEKLKEKPQKGESHRESLRLYKEGKTIAEIAVARNMAETTIEGHLSSFIPSGEVQITSFLKESDLADIKKAIDELMTNQLTPIKNYFEDRFTFGQLRMAIAYLGSNQYQKN